MNHSHQIQLPFSAGIESILVDGFPPEEMEATLAHHAVGPIVAVDEAGRGPLAGPVVAGAVVFDGPCNVAGVNDSKKLNREKRASLVEPIKVHARAWAIGIATAREIDEINILQATRLAAMRAIRALGVAPAIALTDALTLPDLACPVVPIIKGDARVRAIGAASILAKEHRDDLMRRLDEEYPLFGFAEHFGYPTPLHRARVIDHGPSTMHRLTFRGAQPTQGADLVRSKSFQRIVAEGSLPSGEEWQCLCALLPECEIEELTKRCVAR